MIFYGTVILDGFVKGCFFACQGMKQDKESRRQSQANRTGHSGVSVRLKNAVLNRG
jgi:hypothetical protein